MIPTSTIRSRQSQPNIQSVRTIKALEEIRRSRQIQKAALNTIRGSAIRAKDEIKATNTKKDISGKISKIGLALIVCPDPFTTVAGVPLLAVGRIMKRANASLTLSDVSEEARSTIETLRESQI